MCVRVRTHLHGSPEHLVGSCVVLGAGLDQWLSLGLIQQPYLKRVFCVGLRSSCEILPSPHAALWAPLSLCGSLSFFSGTVQALPLALGHQEKGKSSGKPEAFRPHRIIFRSAGTQS